jgi:hypothetical protein
MDYVIVDALAGSFVFPQGMFIIPHAVSVLPHTAGFVKEVNLTLRRNYLVKFTFLHVYGRARPTGF